jgi:hypothetical protein
MKEKKTDRRETTDIVRTCSSSRKLHIIAFGFEMEPDGASEQEQQNKTGPEIEKK